MQTKTQKIIIQIWNQGSGKKIHCLIDTDKIYLYAKEPNPAIYRLLLTSEKVETEIILTILKLLWNTRMIGMIFIRVLKNTIQIRNEKY